MDPLRSFAELLGSMWRARRGEPVAKTSAVGRQTERAPAARTSESLRTRLRNRMIDVGTSDPRRARDAFVETVLGWELGEELARDPAFGEIVRRLSDHIESEPRLNARLRQLLEELASEQ